MTFSVIAQSTFNVSVFATFILCLCKTLTTSKKIIELLYQDEYFLEKKTNKTRQNKRCDQNKVLLLICIDLKRKAF